MIKRFILTVFIASAVFFATMATADLADFQNFLNDNPEIKIYVDLKNSSGDDKVDISLLKKLLEEAFSARKSNKFIISNTADEADIILKGDVVEYVWSENDPVDHVWGIGSAAMDAATSDNYARMQVEAALIAVKHNRILWSDRVQANMTKNIMPKDSSYELIYPRFIKSVITEIFRKRTADSKIL